jgi:hypothetical protein
MAPQTKDVNKSVAHTDAAEKAIARLLRDSVKRFSKDEWEF